MSDDELAQLRSQARDDRKLIKKAAEALAEIDRTDGLSDLHADVLAALRLRLEGKPRPSLEDLMKAAGDISGKKDLGEVLTGADDKPASEWPEIEEEKKDGPGL